MTKSVIYFRISCLFYCVKINKKAPDSADFIQILIFGLCLGLLKRIHAKKHKKTPREKEVRKPGGLLKYVICKA